VAQKGQEREPDFILGKGRQRGQTETVRKGFLCEQTEYGVCVANIYRQKHAENIEAAGLLVKPQFYKECAVYSGRKIGSA
jgi:hypothetical protein